MRLGKLIKENFRWTLDKDYFMDLSAQPTSEKQLVFQLQKLAEQQFPLLKPIETNRTEFCLNSVALSFASDNLQKQIKSMFDGYWQSYLRLREKFSKQYMLFPADEQKTRLEKIAELLTKSTQFCADAESMGSIKNHIENLFGLSDREKKYLDDAVALYKVKFYCMAARSAFASLPFAERHIAALIGSTDLIRSVYRANDYYSRALFRGGTLFSAIDCLANSSVFAAGKKTGIETAVKFFSAKRNVFDTFCFHKYGKKTAGFQSVTKSLAVTMQYFLRGKCEIRRFTVENRGKAARKLTAEIRFGVSDASQATYFKTDRSHCLGISGSAGIYSALTVVEGNCAVNTRYDNGRVIYPQRIPSGSSVCFDVVTAYSSDIEGLTEAIEELDCYGATECPYSSDTAEEGDLYTEKLHVSPANGLIGSDAPARADILDFSYQFGNSDVATFADNGGHSATLLKGFVFGTSGESYYAVTHGKAVKLNVGEFSVFQNGMTYSKTIGTQRCSTEISHGEGKTARISLTEKSRILAYFPLEERSDITFDGKTFTVKSAKRSFSVCCFGKIESFTTNAIECNTDRLRYRLSGDLDGGRCIAVCFAPSNTAGTRIISAEAAPQEKPIVKESLISTYLNYINSKNTFCLENRLKKADALTLAAICYTNPDYVKKYVSSLAQNEQYLSRGETEYYDNTGKLKKYVDKTLLPLAALYFATLSNDVSVFSDEVKNYTEKVMYTDSVNGKQLCVKALALKKMSQLDCFDKVRALIEYTNVKKIISSDKDLNKYAQAVGASAMCNPSKQRLKDLCNQFDIPRAWYYVSQIENLYGVSINCGRLTVRPNVSAENKLEQFALNLCGKRIDTVFSKGSVQSMSVNGVTCFQGFDPSALKHDDNTLVVRY